MPLTDLSSRGDSGRQADRVKTHTTLRHLEVVTGGTGGAFKGSILATNRKKDLDEAFLRRLRFVVEFPLPGAAERLRIWRSVVPEGVDASGVDFEFLAQRFALSGGHIRAIVFQACLQSASEGAVRQLTMPAVVRAVQREYEKLDRANSLEQFGPYASLVTPQRNAMTAAPGFDA